MRPSPKMIIWTVLYLVMLAVVGSAMFRARGELVDVYATPEQQAEWERWREESQRQADGNGPVARRPATSEQPPGLVLMRDHFPALLGGALLMSSVLFAAFAFFVNGMWFSTTPGAPFPRDERRTPR